MSMLVRIRIERRPLSRPALDVCHSGPTWNGWRTLLKSAGCGPTPPASKTGKAVAALAGEEDAEGLQAADVRLHVANLRSAARGLSAEGRCQDVRHVGEGMVSEDSAGVEPL